MAYRLLGSLGEADDAVHEAWLRLHRIDPDTVEDLGGWLTTVVSRVCMRKLRNE
jgi:RNA polymerase sigma-70 factor (ECF subfamily)